MGGGSSDVADDGPHKLVTPATVLGGEYKKGTGADEAGGMTADDLKDAESWGVKNAKDVNASYQAGSVEENPLAAKMITFGGVYGEIDDPEKTVDAMFASMKADATKEGEGGSLEGSPQSFEPAGLDGAVMKCQAMTLSEEASGTPTEIKFSICIWGDHSTVGFSMPVDLGSAMGGKSGSLEEAAATTAKLRDDVRVKL